MTDKAIQVENLSKRYRLGQTLTLRQCLAGMLSHLKRGGAGKDDAHTTEFWALRDVSLAVRPGEVLGLIGRNGAGKSTLLKILSRITEPTSGRALLRGRVASLLEVGTGFHPELTGRENVFLNGSILGMPRREIQNKFDEIVAFSGTEEFLDTPVKRYSSGMRVRLAFAVAAHIDPQILIIDEVLAVGDASFQMKCLGKMQTMAGQQGRSVIFVSHNMKAVRSLCHRVAWLDNGRLRDIGEPQRVIGEYLETEMPVADVSQLQTLIDGLPIDPDFRMIRADVTQHGRTSTHVGNDAPVQITMEYEVLQPCPGLRVYFDLCDEHNDILIRSFNDEMQEQVGVVKPGRYTATAEIPPLLLAPREYKLILRGTIFNVRPLTGDGLAIRLSVQHTNRLNMAYPQDPIRSKIQPHIPWQTRRVA